MNRKDLLTANFTEDKNVATVIKATLAKDVRFLDREKTKLSQEIEDAEEALELRLSSSTVIDASVILVSFSGIADLKAKLALYKEFESKYITDEK